MIGLKFLRHRNRFMARFSAETSDSRKYVYVRVPHQSREISFGTAGTLMLAKSLNELCQGVRILKSLA